MVTLREAALREPSISKIQLTNGGHAFVDTADLSEVQKYKWFSSKLGKTRYALSTQAGANRILMHRLILGVANKLIVDHIDRNGLNNTRNNLRACSHSQNKANMGPNRKNTSGFRGVSFDKSRNKWAAKIRHNDKWINLGRFDEKEEAVKAYCKKMKEMFGEFFNDYEVLTKLTGGN